MIFGKIFKIELTNKGFKVIAPTSKKCDLTKLISFLNIKRNINIYLFSSSTQAGDFCLKYPGEQWIINQKINTNVLSWWKDYQPQAKLIFMEPVVLMLKKVKRKIISKGRPY